MDISVIVVNYNSSEHTINCVSSILAQTKGHFTALFPVRVGEYFNSTR